MPKISVVIPTYNCAKYLAEAIDSALAQTYQDFNIIVVDNASEDTTQEVLSRYTDNQVKVFRFNENRGAAAARNKGMEMSDGKYIAFLDSDDVIAAGSLERRALLLDGHPEVSLAFSDYDVKDRFQSRRARLKESGFLQFFEGFVSSSEGTEVIFDENFCSKYYDFVHYPIWTGTVMIRREVIGRIGYFRSDLKTVSEDIDYWLRIAENNKIGFVDESLATYNYDRSNLSKTTTENNCFRKIEKNVALLQQGQKAFEAKGEISQAYYDLGCFYMQGSRFNKCFKVGLRSLSYGGNNLKNIKMIFFSLPLNFLSERSPWFRRVREKVRNSVLGMRTKGCVKR